MDCQLNPGMAFWSSQGLEAFSQSSLRVVRTVQFWDQVCFKAAIGDKTNAAAIPDTTMRAISHKNAYEV
jgi:hypothetical protein